MNRDELIIKIKSIAKQALANRKKVEVAAVEYDELTKFPELKKVIVDLLTSDFDYFLASIQWVAPRPTTFKIVLANGQFFYFIYTERSWIAQIEGKKYYLLNINEEERASEAISRILMYGNKSEPDKDTSATVPSGGEETSPETPPAGEETSTEETPPAGEEVPEELPT